MKVGCEGKKGSVWRVSFTPDGAGGMALDGPGLDALHRALLEADVGPCRILILSGGPETFCTGLDLQGLEGLFAGEVGERCDQFTACLELLAGGGFLSVALVEGAATGGGVGLVAAADLALAYKDATFNLPEVTLGLLPAMVLPTLLARMPRQKARLLSLGGVMDASRAQELGLVDHVLDSTAALNKTMSRLLRQALRCEPGALAHLKRLDHELAGMAPEEARAEAARQAAEQFTAPEIRGRVRAFLDGELPPWFERPPRIKEPTS